MRRSSLARLAAGCTLALTVPLTVFAQQTGAAATPQGAVRTDPGGKKILGFTDIGRWNRITNAALSNDGKWMSYIYQPNEGDATIFVRQLDGGKVDTIARGSAPVFSSMAVDLTITNLLPLFAGRPVHSLPEENAVEALADVLRSRPRFGLIKITPTHLTLLTPMLTAEEARETANTLVSVSGEKCQRAW